MDIEKIEDFTADELSAVVAVATKKQTESAWIEAYLKSVSSLLGKSPGTYRHYGAYWWQIKSMMIARGIGNTEWSADSIPSDMLQRTDCGSDALNLAAAHSYSEYVFDKLANESNVHSHTVGDSAEDIQVWDDDLEVRMITP